MNGLIKGLETSLIDNKRFILNTIGCAIDGSRTPHVIGYQLIFYLLHIVKDRPI